MQVTPKDADELSLINADKCRYAREWGKEICLKSNATIMQMLPEELSLPSPIYRHSLVF